MDLENDDSDNSLELSDFELSDEDVPDDDYFKQHVDVNVGDILDEVVGSSQLMRIEPNENVQTNMGVIREEDIMDMLSDYESEEIEEVDRIISC